MSSQEGSELLKESTTGTFTLFLPYLFWLYVLATKTSTGTDLCLPLWMDAAEC